MDLIEKAIIFATKAHSGQKRKLNNTDYILHPLEVAATIASITPKEETIVAGILHDTIEDTSATLGEIEEQFGMEVAKLVLSETENKMRSEKQEDTWMIRKKDSLKILEETDLMDVKILWLADKLSNLRSIHQTYLLIGDDLWQQFHQRDKSKHRWYYQSILRDVKELENTAAYQEFLFLFNAIFGEEE